MSTKSWVLPVGTFVAGAIVVAGVWGIVGLVGGPAPQQSGVPTQSEPAATPQSEPTQESAGEQAEGNNRPAANQSSITPIDQVTRNQMVTVVGTVTQLRDEDEFEVTDESGSITVWTGNAFFTVEQGESVQVTGFVDDDLFIEIYATEIVKESGEVISIGGYSSE